MDNLNDIRKDIERQFVEKANDWKKFLEEVNKTIKKLDPTFEDSELFTYDTLCQSVLDSAMDITKASAKQGQVMPTEQILKEIYKRLVMSKLKDVKFQIKPKKK